MSTDSVPTRTAVVTGASSGIGAATARMLAAQGFRVVCAARRRDRVEALAAEIGGTAVACDVTVDDDVARLAAAAGDRVHVLVNNAGGALGLEPVAEADVDLWRQMYDTNVLGVMHMTRALLPTLLESGDGHVIVVGSIAAHESYAGGAGYNAAKFGARAVVGALREELLGQPIRVTEVDPGMVETEFSLVRFAGDADRAASVYQGVTPLTADDVAECIVFAATRPSHVNIDQMIVLPRQQIDPPDEPTRAAMQRVSSTPGEYLKGMATLVEAEGFIAASVRAIMMRLQARGAQGPAPNVFRTPAEVAVWAAAVLQDREITSERLAEVIRLARQG